LAFLGPVSGTAAAFDLHDEAAWLVLTGFSCPVSLPV
jgi:hypothetical protein